MIFTRNKQAVYFPAIFRNIFFLFSKNTIVSYMFITNKRNQPQALDAFFFYFPLISGILSVSSSSIVIFCKSDDSVVFPSP